MGLLGMWHRQDGDRGVGGVSIGHASDYGADLTNYQVINIAATSLTTSVQQINVPLIANPNGRPCRKITFHFSRVDTTGATLAPSGVAIAENTFYRFILKGRSGRTILDMLGANLDMYKWQHLKNPLGYYVASVAPADTATSTAYTSNYDFVLMHSIPASEFPLTPYVYLNTLASSATTMNGMTVTAALLVKMDFVSHSFVPSVLVNKIVAQSATGNITITPQLDFDKYYRSFAIDAGADSNLTSTGTFNQTVSGVPLLNSVDFQSIINDENAIGLNSSNTKHISGFFPFLPRMRYLSTPANNVQVNFGSAPSVNGTSNEYELFIEEEY